MSAVIARTLAVALVFLVLYTTTFSWSIIPASWVSASYALRAIKQPVSTRSDAPSPPFATPTQSRNGDEELKVSIRKSRRNRKGWIKTHKVVKHHSSHKIVRKTKWVKQTRWVKQHHWVKHPYTHKRTHSSRFRSTHTRHSKRRHRSRIKFKNRRKHPRTRRFKSRRKHRITRKFKSRRKHKIHRRRTKIHRYRIRRKRKHRSRKHKPRRKPRHRRRKIRKGPKSYRHHFRKLHRPRRHKVRFSRRGVRKTKWVKKTRWVKKDRWVKIHNRRSWIRNTHHRWRPRPNARSRRNGRKAIHWKKLSRNEVHRRGKKIFVKHHLRKRSKSFGSTTIKHNSVTYSRSVLRHRHAEARLKEQIAARERRHLRQLEKHRARLLLHRRFLRQRAREVALAAKRRRENAARFAAKRAAEAEARRVSKLAAIKAAFEAKKRAREELILKQKEYELKQKLLLTEKKEKGLGKVQSDLKSVQYRYSGDYPPYCMCKLVPTNENSHCYYFPDPSETTCASRRCTPGYFCVNGQNTGVTCMRRVNAEKIEPLGDGTCKTVNKESYMYVPYSIGFDRYFSA